MSDPTRAPAGWYEDGSGGRRYWDGDAWTQYVAPASESASSPPVEPDPATTAMLPTGNDGPTIPFVWGSRGSDAAASEYGGAAPLNDGREQPYAYLADAPTMPHAAVGANPDAMMSSYGAQPTTVLPGHPFTEPSNPGPHVVSIVALVAAAVGLVFVFLPAVSWVAWILVPVALVLSLIGLSLRGAKWPAVTGLVVSIIAAIVAIVMFVTFLIGSVGNAVDEFDDSIPDVPVFPQPGPDDPGADPDPQPDQPEAPGASEFAFGEAMTWDDGVALTVSAPEPYTPSDLAVGATRANHVVFTLTATNNSTADLQLLPLPTLSAGDQEVSQIFDVGSDLIDPADDVGIPPAATLEPGGSVSWRAAWSVDDPNSLALQVAPNFMYPSATFTNAP